MQFCSSNTSADDTAVRPQPSDHLHSRRRRRLTRYTTRLCCRPIRRPLLLRKRTELVASLHAATAPNSTTERASQVASVRSGQESLDDNMFFDASARHNVWRGTCRRPSRYRTQSTTPAMSHESTTTQTVSGIQARMIAATVAGSARHPTVPKEAVPRRSMHNRSCSSSKTWLPNMCKMETWFSYRQEFCFLDGNGGHQPHKKYYSIMKEESCLPLADKRHLKH